MGFIKGIFTFIGLIVVGAMVFAFVKFGAPVAALDSKAIGLYMNMFGGVLETGKAADAMSLKVKVNDDVTNDDIKDIIESFASDGNMALVGDVTIFDGSPIDASGAPTRYARTFSLCSRPIAQKFLNYSMAMGAFMPCRIMLQEDENGDRWLNTMDMGLMIHGGQTLTPELLKMAEQVRDTVYGAMYAAAKGDF